MEKGGIGPMTGIYALVHMAVDLSCAFLIYAYVAGRGQWYIWLLIYNFCAFAMQMPVGVIADHLDRNSRVAAAGCMGVLAGLMMGAAGYPAAASVAAGLGNACFHVGGGIDVLNGSGGRMAPLGVFVAPGALGIFLGGILGKPGGILGEPGGIPGKPGEGLALWVAILLVLSALAVWAGAVRYGLWRESGNEPFSMGLSAVRGTSCVSGPGPVAGKNSATEAGKGSFSSSSGTRFRPLPVLAVACLFAAVVLRSCSGMVQSFPWKETVAGSAWLLTGAVVLGKMAGGILGDRIGVREAARCSMCAAAAGFLCLHHPAAGILAVFFWNMSMPLTLWAAARIFPGARGFSFGLLTFGLFVGFCPVYLAGSNTQTVLGRMAAASFFAVGMALMALVSFWLLSWGLRQVRP